MKAYQNIIPSFDAKRVQLGKVLPLDTPFTVILDASELCNFRCNYCFRSEENENAWGYAVDRQLMDWRTFETAVSQIWQFPQSVRQISLSHQGEPLVNRRLPEMIRFIKAHGFDGRVSIHTNGSLLTKEYAEDLADSGIDRVIVSLQGLSAEAYQSVCGVSINFDELYQNLKYFYQVKRNTQFNIKIVNTALKEGEEEKFYQLFSGIADRVFVEKVIPLWKEKDYSNILSDTKLEFNKYGEGFPVQKVCPLIFHTIVVIPNGDVYPCTQLLCKEKLGNIHEKTLVEMWNGNLRKEMLRMQCELRAPELCTDCGIRPNTIYTKEDMIDEHREEILERINSI